MAKRPADAKNYKEFFNEAFAFLLAARVGVPMLPCAIVEMQRDFGSGFGPGRYFGTQILRDYCALPKDSHVASVIDMFDAEVIHVLMAFDELLLSRTERPKTTYVREPTTERGPSHALQWITQTLLLEVTGLSSI